MPSDDVHPATAAPTDPAALPAHLPASLHMAVHDSLESAEARWREAWTRLAGTPFQSFDWVRIWYDTLGRQQGYKPCIGELRADTPDGPTVLLLPLAMRRKGLLRVMYFMGAELLDYQAPLIDPAFARALSPAHAARLWNGFMHIFPSVDMIHTRRMPATIGELANPFSALPGAVHDENASAARLPADFATFAATRDTRLFADSRRQMRRLAASGTVRMLTEVEEPALRARVMQALFEQKSHRWNETGSIDAFALPGYREFFAALADGPLQGVDSMVSALLVDDRIIATHWGMRRGERFYWLMPTYDAAWGPFSPGRLLMEAVVRRAIDDGLKVFDLTAGDEAYKRQWVDEKVKLYTLKQSFSTVGNYALHFDRAKALAKRSPLLRQWVRKLRGQKP
ncbi:GNAT family N-acetyltransferase [Xylophilus sp. Kf1]|nr:GNAT family N-acetyltransferase [Xylophilus sp. Kf1]